MNCYYNNIIDHQSIAREKRESNFAPYLDCEQIDRCKVAVKHQVPAIKGFDLNTEYDCIQQVQKMRTGNH